MCIDAACLDCGDPVTVEMRDGRLLGRACSSDRKRFMPVQRNGGRLPGGAESVVEMSDRLDPEAFQARAEEGFIGLVKLACFFGTESRQHMLAADYLSVWYPRRAEERRAYLAKLGTTSPFPLGTAEPDAA